VFSGRGPCRRFIRDTEDRLEELSSEVLREQQCGQKSSPRLDNWNWKYRVKNQENRNTTEYNTENEY
jgi:hypothetical protein